MKPLKIHPALICLGELLEIHIDNFVYKWAIKDGMRLYSSPLGKKLYALNAKPKASTDAHMKKIVSRHRLKVNQGLALYEKWHDFEAASASVIDVPRGNVSQIGRCSQILYRSDKWTGKPTRYYHDFKTPPLVWATSKNAPRALILTGGKIRVKAEGITG
jgi:hypothetical protein